MNTLCQHDGVCSRVGVGTPTHLDVSNEVGGQRADAVALALADVTKEEFLAAAAAAEPTSGSG